MRSWNDKVLTGKELILQLKSSLMSHGIQRIQNALEILLRSNAITDDRGKHQSTQNPTRLPENRGLELAEPFQANDDSITEKQTSWPE